MGKKKKPVNSDVYGPLSLFVILFVALAVQFSNRLVDDLKRLASLAI